MDFADVFRAGNAVARNVRFADMNIDVPVSDDRRIEAVANHLSHRRRSTPPL